MSACEGRASFGPHESTIRVAPQGAIRLVRALQSTLVLSVLPHPLAFMEEPSKRD